MTPISVHRRMILFAAALVVILAGCALRLVPLGLPAGLVKYGGSVLWGAMVYCLVATFLAGTRSRIVVLASLALAVAVEIVRLVHTPWLDAFRLTLAGQLLLGRIFSLWNIVAYAAGIGTAAAIDDASRRSR